ncbi:MAG: fructosamine kinase family protein [Candidatus Nanopelagicales bacterium]|nr:fructosamine kinase family protein [Candidatus Nanopelagicales bacterium]MDZ4250724.1 fructosamine kinase family protein [Candidatus Nanopelagicales bacterium]MDZ7577651.1 fructosamine kinase family protein [Candidatus Nanopelagicales bacterium]
MSETNSSRAARRALERLGLRAPRLTTVSGGSICDAWRAETDEGTLFIKVHGAGPSDMFLTEAAGLTWLADAGAPVPEVIGADSESLVLRWLDRSRPDARMAREFGATLARLHQTPADGFGVAPPGATHGYIGSAPMPYGRWDAWGPFYAEARVLPYAQQAHALGHLTGQDLRVIDRLCDRLIAQDPELTAGAAGPVRVHGDLWHGNVLWTSRGAFLIDAAAHGGCGFTDLAMLVLFGTPNLGEIVTGYRSVADLPPSWHQRLGLHQLFPLLVHAVLFGGGYGPRAAAIAANHA